MKMSGNYLIASSYDGGYDTAILVDLAANKVVTMEQAETIADLAIGGDKFAFFSHHDSDDSVGLHFRGGRHAARPNLQQAADRQLHRRQLHQ